MVRRPLPARLRIALGAACVVAVLGAYAWVSHAKHAENPRNTTVPNLTQFRDGWRRMVEPDRAGERWLLIDLEATYVRFAVGMAVGVTLAFTVGVAMGAVSEIGAFLAPTVLFFGSVPPTAMLALYMVAFGIDFGLYVGMIALSIFPLLGLTVYGAVLKDVSDHAVSKAYTLGASHAEVVWNVICRQILPRFLEAVRLAAGLGMIFLIAAEWGVADVGVGYRLRMQGRLQDMAVVYSYLVILGAVGLALDFALVRLRRRLCPWWGE